MIPLLDLVAQYRSIQPEIDAAIRQVLDGGHFILGPNVAALEAEVATYLGVKHGVGVASGTDALVLALRALGIGPGDEVIVPAYTFFATAEAVLLVGAKPIFVDVNPDTYCIDVAQVAGRITNRTKSIIPVHLYGHPADMGPLMDLARSRNLKVVEDNAQAFGAACHGAKTGAIGDVGCISFFPSKNLGGFGDGGMVVTNDPAVAERVKMLRTHGWKKKYFPEEVGYNSRLDEIQAAILRVKLKYIDRWNDERRRLAARFNARLRELGIGIPYEAAGARHVYHLYVVRVNDRPQVEKALKEAGVSSAVYYPKPLHVLPPCIAPGADPASLPVSEKASLETLSLPLYPEMTAQQIEGVLAGVERATTVGATR
jgi:dTDP-4-amino-4,6-dideoxygalactose transaminase